MDDGGHPGAADEVDVEVRANLVSASASYTCSSEFLSSSSTQLARASADNVLENENCRDKNVMNGANFLIDLKVPLYREITT